MKLTSKYLVQENFDVVWRKGLMWNYNFMQIALQQLRYNVSAESQGKLRYSLDG